MGKILIHPPEGLTSAILAEYLRRCRDQMPILNEALGRRDYEYLRTYGHQMAGCGGAFGFTELTGAGARMESSAKAQNGAELQDQVRAFERYLASVEIAPD